MSTDRAKQREQLRAQAPDLAAFVDEVRDVFGPDVKITYLKIGAQEFGVKSESVYALPHEPEQAESPYRGKRLSK